MLQAHTEAKLEFC